MEKTSPDSIAEIKAAAAYGATPEMILDGALMMAHSSDDEEMIEFIEKHRLAFLLLFVSIRVFAIEKSEFTFHERI